MGRSSQKFVRLRLEFTAATKNSALPVVAVVLGGEKTWSLMLRREDLVVDDETLHVFGDVAPSGVFVPSPPPR